MIKIIDDDKILLEKFKEFCKRDSLGTRIYSHYLCYGCKYNFVDFWVQIDENKEATAAVLRLDGDFVVSLCDGADFTELSEFFSFQNKVSVTYSKRYDNKFNLSFDTSYIGDVLLFSGKLRENIADHSIEAVELKDYYNLLKMCESENFFVPEYEYFLSDTVLRQRKNMCEVYGTMSDCELTSAAMSVACTDSSVILGAVATNPNYRKHGYASAVVSSLAKYYFDNGLKVYIYTTIPKNTRFYESLNFTVCDKWVKLTFKR